MKRWIPAVIIAVALVVVGGWVMLRGREDEPAATASCPFPAPPTPGQVPIGIAGTGGQTITAPPGGSGTLKVIDAGFTMFDGASKVTIGAVVENATTQVAYQTQVIFRATAADGSAGIGQAETYRHMFEIPILRPGQRAVIGDFANVRSRVTKAGLELIRTQWIPAGDTASYPAINATAAGSAETGGIPVTTTSDACHDLVDRGVSLVFRNAAGKIVGGTFDLYSKAGLCRTPTSHREILSFPSVPAGADLGRTQATVFCDVTGPASADPGPDQAVN
ncbi:hypothetical protein [Actinoplanes sp. L3-i22]|uniref:hypothetical protein n=1 Tax=Actinoplanes sp. L3-i22 TaxID=2836373 RepID=UPI001C742E12|nr:hypothetical protein [Actinoplanes sp. L3-i22]BCY11932.1 hypothetical protein L3i22_070200 [Actinoplanes sp. L3-i22]